VKVLLDTCTLAEIRKPEGNPAVKRVVGEVPDEDLYLSVLTLGEIVKGIALLAAGKKKKTLNSWLVALESHFEERILSLDAETARIWGELTARAQKRGVIVPASDGLIAATALRHGLHVMTRNTKHFEATGVFVVDPWHDA
jgi:predicted nucleic acid-binding protein